MVADYTANVVDKLNVYTHFGGTSSAFRPPKGLRAAFYSSQYDAVHAIPAAMTRSRMAFNSAGVALRSALSGVSRSMV